MTHLWAESIIFVCFEEKMHNFARELTFFDKNMLFIATIPLKKQQFPLVQLRHAQQWMQLFTLWMPQSLHLPHDHSSTLTEPQWIHIQSWDNSTEPVTS